jgi:hypothetical protein
VATFTAASSGVAAINIACITNPSAFRGESYAGDSSSGIFAYGAQLELASSVSSYQQLTDVTSDFISVFANNHFVYQDFQGNAAAAAPGDLVGMVIDQSKNSFNNLGNELITDGTFTIGSGWTLTDATVSGGLLNASTAGSAVIVAQRSEAAVTALTTTGTVVRVQYTISNYSSGQIRVRVGSSGNQTALRSGNGTYTETIALTSGTSFTTGFTTGPSGFIGSLDNLSIKVVPGNHAYQSTSGARPTLGRVPFGGRRNLLTRSEEFDNAAWVKSNGTVTANQAVAPDGTTTADRLVGDIGLNAGRAAQLFTGATNTQYTLTCYAKTAGGTLVRLNADDSGSNSVACNFSTLDGTASSNTATGTWVLNSYDATLVGNGWYRCRITFTTTGAALTRVVVWHRDTSDGTNGILLWGAQLETGSTATNYQRVGSTHDCTEAGQPDCWYLDTSGSKWMQTSAINFAGWTQDTRRNLLSGTEQFGSPWSAPTAGTTYGELGPEGRLNGSTFNTGTSAGQTHVHSNVPYTPSQPHVVTFWLKAGTTGNASFGMYANAAFLSQTGTILSGPGTITGTTIQTIGLLSSSEWTKFQVTFTAPASGNLEFYFYGETTVVKTSKTMSIAQCQVELGSTPTAYQPTGTDEMTAIAGVRKLSDAAIGMVLESSATVSGNNGSFFLLAGPTVSTGPNWTFSTKGTTQVSAVSTNSFAAPITNVLSGIGDISGDLCQNRINGTLNVQILTDQGSGNFGNHIVYLFGRAGTSLFLNGHLFHLIVRGKTTEGSKLTGAERITAKKTGITI